MKPYLKLIVIYFFLLLGMILLLRLLAEWLLKRPMDAPVLVTGIVWMVLFSMIYWGVLIREFKPRLDYIQKAGTEPPEFKLMITRKLEIPDNNFSMKKLLEMLVPLYEVTYSNETLRVIKLRDRFSFCYWGACTFIQYQKDEGLLLLTSYPLSTRATKQGNEGEKQNHDIIKSIQPLIEID